MTHHHAHGRARCPGALRGDPQYNRPPSCTTIGSSPRARRPRLPRAHRAGRLRRGEPCRARRLGRPGRAGPGLGRSVRDVHPGRRRSPLGAAVGDDVDPRRGRVPESWAGRAVELVIDLGFDPDEAGFQCEALAFGPDGAPLKGCTRGAVGCAWRRPRGGEPVLLYLEAAANPRLRGRAQGRPPRRSAGRAVGPRRRVGRGAWARGGPALPHRAGGAPRLRGGGLGARSGRRGGERVDARPLDRRSPALGPPARPGPCRRRARSGRRTRHVRRVASRPRRCPRAARSRERPPRRRRRPRAHRHGVALAGARVDAEGRAHLGERPRAHG